MFVISTDIGIWVSTLLTLAIFSFLVKDNPFYKMAEHIFVGSSAGYWVVRTYQNVLKTDLIEPLGKVGKEPKNWMLIVPLILGILMLSKLFKNYAWLSRYSLAFTVGTGAGYSITAFIKSDIIGQIYSTAFNRPLWMVIDGQVDHWLSFFNLIYVIAVLTSLLYFFFSAEHKGWVGHTARVGIWFLMICFGASFGFTVMARISLLIARVQFILEKTLGMAI